MSLQSAIPWWDALQQSPPPLHRPASGCDKLTLPVHQHWDQATELPRSTSTACQNHGSLNRKTERPLKNRRKLSEQPGPPLLEAKASQTAPGRSNKQIHRRITHTS